MRSATIGFHRVIAVMVLVSATAANAQLGAYFGQNKILYKDFAWEVYRTEHFDVHYYPEEQQAAYDAARMAERGYDYLSERFDHKIKERIPLILYASLNDFQQTNVVSGMLGQGTRGVTESLKNRVVLPLTGSYRELNHVLVHELVHAFQFDMLLKGRGRTARFDPPLWFVEGLAEYLSVGMDNTTRMWVRDGLYHDDLLTLEKLNTTYDIRVYRLGEAVWHFIAERYGKEAVRDVFKSAIRLGSVEKGFKAVLKSDMKALNAHWLAAARSLAMPSDSSLTAPANAARQLTHQQGYYHRLNVAPAISPDGNHIVYVANKDLQDGIYLLSQAAAGDWTETKLLQGGSSGRFEEVRYFDSAIGWSADGSQVAFVAKSGKDDALYVMNPHTREIQHSFTFATLNGMQSPDFSPSGEDIAFVGISGGIGDLYSVRLSDGRLTRLTQDRFSVLHPRWSPDSESIAFATDRGSGTSETELLFGDFDLAEYRFRDKSIRMLTDLAGDATNPHWLDGGNQIAFQSDHSGIANVYRLTPGDSVLTPMTALRNGVSGITASTPAFSWSVNSQRMVFSAFDKQQWHLFLSEPPLLSRLAATAEPGAMALMTAGLSQASAPEKSAAALVVSEVPDPNTLYAGYALAEQSTISEHAYKSRFKLDAVLFGGGYSSYFGTSGLAQLLFSDMMGNHTLYLSSALQLTDPAHSDLGVTYLNQGHRLQYGLQLFQANLLYATGYSFNSTEYVRYTYRGFNGIASYPFNRFIRAELSAGLTWLDADYVQDVFNASSLDRETFDLGGFNYAQVGTALIFDNTIYGPLGPTSGSRSRFSVETTTKGFQFTNMLADYRKYVGIGHRSVLAWRFMGGASMGRDPQYFYLGGPYTFRGADFSDLIGDRFLLSNLEYRFPMLPFLPAGFDWLSAATFFDAAAAWGVDIPGYGQETFQPFTSAGGAGFRLKDLNAAIGVGARLNLGFFLLGFDVAWPTDLRSFGSPIKLFSIGSYF